MPILGAIYLGAALILWRYFTGAIYRIALESNDPLVAIFSGFWAAVVWPFSLSVILLAEAYLRWPEAVWRIFIHESSKFRKERKIAAAKEQIKRLERDLKEKEPVWH